MDDTARALKNLRVIPGVGGSIAHDLLSLGYRSIDDLRGQDPEAMYARLCQQTGAHVDRCMLYVFRCAVYFATSDSHDPHLLKWWRWKDTRPPRPSPIP